ncbi:small ribosomal subunit protein uS3m [Cynoglossus semilaevis]|uniref:Mitochondrial ribosomal protein S24 n=1 Tax=Cynoglossus semilaevis TaxID=244447 RepID=A0A3P8VDM8_CYNSE|nr:28S ribosomal protein S24, mitochondrial [Cynoglossus semilaevis]
MAASLNGATGVRLLGSWVRLGSQGFFPGSKGLHTTAVCCKNFAARIRVGKGEKAVTYEQSFHPHHIGHRKGWLSQHPGNLHGEDGAAERTLEDVFIRKFIFGTFQECLVDEIVIKRRGNLLVVCALMINVISPIKFYFLIGYSETLLSHFYKCPVKIEIQTLPKKVVYKRI